MDVTSTSTGARGFGFLLMGNEILYMIGEARYAVVLLFLLIIVDFRFGRRESSDRFERAKLTGDTCTMNKYQWRTSRAVRRSINKFLDYILFMVLGLFIGIQFLDSVGISHIYGTYGAMAIILLCEFHSIVGHFLYLHDPGVETEQVNSLLKKFIVLLAKKKSEDVGEALEEVLTDKQEDHSEQTNKQ